MISPVPAAVSDKNLAQLYNMRVVYFWPSGRAKKTVAARIRLAMKKPKIRFM